MIRGKKILSLLLVLVMVFSLAACGGNENTDKDKPDGEGEVTPTKNKVKVGMVTDVGGINDRSFNETSWDGIENYKAHTGNEIAFVESHQEAEYPANLNNIVDQDCELVWGIGFALADAVETAAKQNPDVHFATVDFAYGDDMPDNLTGVMFKAQEPSFLVGYIAGLTTETNKVGFVGGEKSFIIDQFEYGYRAGVLEAARELDKEIEVDVQYADSFTDASKGKGIAAKMFSEDADVVFHAAGGVGMGVIEAAKEADKYAIGVDMDQAHLAPEHVLTSALKRVDMATEDLSTRFANGEEIGGKNFEYGLKEGGVGIPEYVEGESIVDKEVYDKAIAKSKELIDGKIVPPYNEETWKEYSE